MLPTLDAALLAALARLFYLVATLLVVATASFPRTRDVLVHYGKLLSPDTVTRAPRGLFGFPLNWRVPKTWFTHFYAFGLAWFGYTAWELASVVCGPPFIGGAPLLRLVLRNDVAGLKADPSLFHEKPAGPTPPAALVASVLMTFQMARRLLESLLLMRPSPALMHVGHYAVGMAFYAVTGVAVWVDSVGWLARCLARHEEHCARSAVSEFLSEPRTVAAIALFAYGSIQQYRSHAILASLRKEEAGTARSRYSLPEAGSFSGLDCPHYFFEILIYTSLVLVSGGKARTLWYCLLWVVVNLGTTAAETGKWYEAKFDAYPRGRKWRMIPLLW
ncbi:3-oxo-5-alpha-steroid 4-dehydrogenase-domain-containing protein [Hyaloraphidium curvatum]|nr:3-oxo-5-alpha-steroid 4-dehydrogenase-domain-containing protein [Hyaloraphidium curvatum]